MRPKKALEMGLIDRISTERSWHADASELTVRKPVAPKPPLLDQLLNIRVLRPLLARMLRKQVGAKANHRTEVEDCISNLDSGPLALHGR